MWWLGHVFSDLVSLIEPWQSWVGIGVLWINENEGFGLPPPLIEPIELNCPIDSPNTRPYWKTMMTICQINWLVVRQIMKEEKNWIIYQINKYFMEHQYTIAKIQCAHWTFRPYPPTGKRERYPPNFGQKTKITPLHFLGTKHLYEPHRTCTILCLFQF